jgi:hypothetical protein
MDRRGDETMPCQANPSGKSRRRLPGVDLILTGRTITAYLKPSARHSHGNASREAAILEPPPAALPRSELST